jgi:2-polyprenyl-3-methyl-5-hydroxy-6-metoxy-1,4-benzoquinol methylase
MKYKGVDIFNIENFKIPIYVDNREFRTANTKNYFEQSMIEANSFEKEDGVIKNKDLIIEVDCPVCEDSKNRQLFVKWGFKIVECSTCSHIFVKNQIRPEKLKDLYSSSDIDKQAQVRKKGDSELSKYWTMLYGKYLQLLTVKHSQKKKINLLDVGAGGGEFIEMCKDIPYPFELFAMEFSDYSKKHLASIVGENRLYRKSISEVDFGDNKFDIITLWGVLEHISNPYKELLKCSKILTKTGNILILVPNIRSRAFGILGVTVPTINPRTHLSYYSYSSMAVLAKRVGLKIDEYFQELPVIDLMYNFVEDTEELLEEIISNNESYYSVYLLSKLNLKD